MKPRLPIPLLLVLFASAVLAEEKAPDPVAEFIKEYELNEGQITAARSILVEFKGKANDFKNAKKKENEEQVLPDRARVRRDKGYPQIQKISVPGPGESEADMAVGLYRL